MTQVQRLRASLSETSGSRSKVRFACGVVCVSECACVCARACVRACVCRENNIKRTTLLINLDGFVISGFV